MIQRCARQILFFAPAAVMAAWGTVMLHTEFSGHINRLLSPMFRSYVLIGGILLLLLSAAYVLLYEPSSSPAPALAPTGRLRQLGRWLVLLLPVIGAAVLSPDALSSTTGNNRQYLGPSEVAAMPSMSAASEQNVKDAMAADPNQPVPVDVTDLITLGHSSEQARSFDGRKVRAVGFVVPGDGGSPKLLRWMMWCCAADAQPVSVKLAGVPTGPFKQDQWYEVVGTAHFAATLGQVVPGIEVESIKPTKEPDEPYLSP